MEEREEECWKPVVGYEGLYEISSHGRLKRLAGYSINRREGYTDSELFHDECILKTRVHYKTGYVLNQLLHQENSKTRRKCVSLHRLVAQAFVIQLKPEQKDVNHINGIKVDNYYKNLEWLTRGENNIHARETGLRKKNKTGSAHPQSLPVHKLNKETREIIKTYGSFGEADRENGISHILIRRVCQGKKKSSGGFGWKYA